VTRILALSDFHAGAHSCIVPPWSKYSQHHLETPLGLLQRELWSMVEQIPEEHRNPDAVFFLGDAIDGKASRNGGRELYTTDRHEQVDMALDILESFNIPDGEFYAVRGTPYHTGVEEDFEDLVAKAYNGKIDNALFVKIEDVTFHLQHKSSSSSYEHNRPSAIARERYFLNLQSDANNYPKVDVILRGHVHYNIGAYGPGWESATLPAFTATGANNYGTRQCKGVVHFGYTFITVHEGEFTLEHFVTPLNTTIPKVYEVKGELNE